MTIDASNNGDLTDITGVHPHITGVDYTNSDFPTPVPDPMLEISKGGNNETKEEDKRSDDEDETGATTPPQIRINEDSYI